MTEVKGYHLLGLDKLITYHLKRHLLADMIDCPDTRVICQLDCGLPSGLCWQ